MGETGADAGFDDGAPVYGFPGLTGCYAQYVACHVERLAPIPEGLRLIDAAATPIDALTETLSGNKNEQGRRPVMDYETFEFKGRDVPASERVRGTRKR